MKARVRVCGPVVVLAAVGRRARRHRVLFDLLLGRNKDVMMKFVLVRPEIHKGEDRAAPVVDTYKTNAVVRFVA